LEENEEGVGQEDLKCAGWEEDEDSDGVGQEQHEDLDGGDRSSTRTWRVLGHDSFTNDEGGEGDMSTASSTSRSHRFRRSQHDRPSYSTLG
jgi:hypothetical protein